MAYSGQQSIRPQTIDWSPWVADWLASNRAGLPGHVVLRFTPCPMSTSVHVDPAQMAEVMARLMAFAGDAILATPSGRGRITVTLDCMVDPVGLPAGEYARLRIAHNGVGLAADALAVLFEPFGAGTEGADDLGLAAVAGVMRQNHGAIACESAPAAGAVLSLLLPMRKDAALLVPQSPSAGRGEIVWLVDDDEVVRAFSAAALRQRGYEVVEFADALAVADMMTKANGGPAILVTDVMMPWLDGTSLAAMARKRLPALPVLYVSSSPGDVLAAGGLLDGDIPLLEKPYSADELALAIRAVIDSAAAR
jgi:CheY-like chemotaxis protein